MTQIQFKPHFSFYFTLPHLQITFTVDEYQALMHQYKGVLRSADSKYWDRLPDYVIARCPFCSASYIAKLDVHALNRMSVHYTRADYLYKPEYQSTGCKHFTGVTAYTNLNGVLPVEYNLWSNWMGDVPLITPTFLPDDVQSYAVMHSLPVCRIEGDIFAPRYSSYILTYYAEDPSIVWNRRKAEMEAIGRAHPNEDMFGHIPIMYTSDSLQTQPELGQLQSWVERGKLLWLDLHSRQLPLRNGPSEDFPYRDIQGYGRSFTYYRKGWLPWHRLLYKEGLVR